MRLLVGTSGYSYPPWKGRFYPADLPTRRMLAYYAGRFPAVEANSTFRGLPSAAAVAGWVADVGPGFRFAIKCPQAITHVRRLRGCAEPLRALLAATDGLGDHRGPLLAQLPPFLRADPPLLDDFLAEVPPGVRVAVEFRHASWFADPVHAILARHGAALCWAESDDLATPPVATAGWGYLRLRRTRYTRPRLVEWAGIIAAQAWDEAFAFFKHEDTATGPRYAQRLREAWDARTPAADQEEPSGR